MTDFILRVSGVNFSATLYDTNDLSVIRGASLMLVGVGDAVVNALRVAGFADLRRLRDGASTVEIALDTDAAGAQRAETTVRDALTSGPWRHLSFVTGVAEASKDRAAARKAAEARCASAQFRQWTVPPCPAPTATRQDALDRVRGASRTDAKGAVSEATKTRLDHGRAQRMNFFTTRLAGPALNGVEFCESFEEMVVGAPKWVPDAARRKIAVMHFDGDGFGAVADKVGADTFAADIRTLSNSLLNRLVGDALFAEERDAPGKPPRLRLETLVWGGDDITLVAPAWRALDLLAGFFDQTKDWAIGGHKLGFTGGCVIASFKAPIRQLTRLAGQAVDLSKDADARGGFTIDIFESAAPPEDGLAAHRARIHGAAVSPCALSFPGTKAGDLRKGMQDWRANAGDTRPARGKVIGWITQTAEMAQAEADALIDRGLADEIARLPGRGDLTADALRLPSRADAARALALDLRLAMELWDYAAAAPVATP